MSRKSNRSPAKAKKKLSSPRPKRGAKAGKERRRSARKDVLETFHVFLAIPKIGLRKVYLKDVSEHGIGFYSEPEDYFQAGESLDLFFHLNPSLRLPLKVKIAHVLNEEGRKKVGCEFLEMSSKAFKSFLMFLRLLDELAQFVEN